MAVFKIGQRVRCVGHYDGPAGIRPECHGKEAVVKGVGSYFGTARDGSKGYQPYLVQLLTGEIYTAEGCDLQPITYDGNQTVEWKDCLWIPEHELDKQLGEMA